MALKDPSQMKELKKLCKKNKYGNKKVVTLADGVFDSKKEYARFKTLCVLERAGEITDLRRQIVYPFELYNIKICKYVCDFAYYKKDDTLVIEDVKSEATRKSRAYRIKKKMMKAFYGIDIQEV